MPEEHKSSNKEAKTSNIIGAVAVALALLLALAIAIPTKAADTEPVQPDTIVVKARLRNTWDSENLPRSGSSTVDWTWTSPAGKTIHMTKIAWSTGTAYADIYTVDGVRGQYSSFMGNRGSVNQVLLYQNPLDPMSNTTIEIRITAGQVVPDWVWVRFEEVNETAPVFVTSRVMTMPTGKYTQLVITEPEFDTPPDVINVEYRQYSTDQWTPYITVEYNNLFPVQYIGNDNDEYIRPGYYRVQNEWNDTDPDNPDGHKSDWTEYNGQIGPSFAPGITYPDITIPEAPEAIQVDPSVNPLPHIWASNIGTTLTVIVIAVLGTAVAAYFVYGRS